MTSVDSDRFRQRTGLPLVPSGALGSPSPAPSEKGREVMDRAVWCALELVRSDDVRPPAGT